MDQGMDRDRSLVARNPLGRFGTAAAIAVPTLFLVGRNDVSYSAERAVQRLAAVAPHIKTEVTDGDHHLTITKPDWVIEHVLGFLEDR